MINRKFILVSGIAGLDVNDYREHLDDDKMLLWVGTNIMWNHSKLMKIPIGFEETERKGGNQEVLNTLYTNRKRFDEKDYKLAITYLSDTHESRNNIKKFFEEKDYVTFLPKLEFGEYMSAINDNKFVLCPRGCGTDTHRFWEVIFNGSVPVLETCGLDDLYDTFPCIIVNDFKEVTQELLDNYVYDEQKLEKVDEYLLIDNLRSKIMKEVLYTRILIEKEKKFDLDSIPKLDILDARPYMQAKQQQTVQKYMEKSQRYYEFGSGGSTYTAIKSCIPFIRSVESDKKYVDGIIKNTDNIHYTLKNEIDKYQRAVDKLEVSSRIKISDTDLGDPYLQMLDDKDSSHFITNKTRLQKLKVEVDRINTVKFDFKISYIDTGAKHDNWGSFRK